MMNAWDSIIQFFTMRFHPQPQGCHPPVAHPKRDWLALFAVLSVIAAGLIALDAFMYFAVITIDIDAAGPSASAQFSLPKLESALKTYEAYAAEHTQWMRSIPTSTDPGR